MKNTKQYIIDIKRKKKKKDDLIYRVFGNWKKVNLRYFDAKWPYIIIDKHFFELIGIIKQDKITRNTRDLHKWGFMIGLGLADDPSTMSKEFCGSNNTSWYF